MRHLGVVLVLAVLAACSADPDQPPIEPTGPTKTTQTAVVEATVVDTLPTQAERAWSVRAQAMSAPVVAGGTVVAVVVARGDELDIVGLDRGNGEERWRHPFQTTRNVDGNYLGALAYTSDVGEPYVVFQQAKTGNALVGDAPEPYVAVDPASGRVLAKTGPVVTDYGPIGCNDGRDACLRIGEKMSLDSTRWSLGTWELTPETDRIPAGGNRVRAGGSVYWIFSAANSSSVGEVGRIGKGGWRRTAKALVGKGWSINSMNSKEHDEEGIAVFGLTRPVTQAQVRRYGSGRPLIFDQARRQTIGLDIESGEVVWRRDGANFDCLELAGSEQPIRCAFTGTTVIRNSTVRSEQRNVTLALEGYDPATGETTWTHPMPDRLAKRILRSTDRYEQSGEIAASDDLRIITDTDGATLLSLVDGSSRAVPGDVALLCDQQVEVRYALDVTEMGGFGVAPRERSVRRACASNTQDSGRPIGVDALLTAGVDLGDGLWAYADRNRIVAVRVS